VPTALEQVVNLTRTTNVGYGTDTTTVDPMSCQSTPRQSVHVGLRVLRLAAALRRCHALATAIAS
jgi:hypothetical protein